MRCNPHIATLKVLRIVVAVSLAAVMFALMSARFDGSCMIREEADVVLLPAIFFVFFVWLGAEIVHPWLTRVSAVPSVPVAIGVGLLLYAFVGAVVWLTSPQLPEDIAVGGNAGTWRGLYSVLWPIGILSHFDTFGSVSCGY